MPIEYDEDAELHRIHLSEEQNQFFNEIVRTHERVIDEPPEDEWIYGLGHGLTLTSHSVSEQAIHAIIDVVVDVWQTNALDADKLNNFIDELEFEGWEDSELPQALRD